jgi:hypothetical protein
MSRSDDMVDGYMAGRASFATELPECHKARSPAFRHGRISGRNDREPEMAEPFSVRQKRAKIILGEFAC